MGHISSLGNKSSLILILVFTSVIVIDSTFVDFIIQSNTKFSKVSYVVIFIILSAIFTTTGIVLLKSLRGKDPQYTYKLPLGAKYFNAFIFVIHFFNAGIILLIIFQMILLNRYNILSLVVGSYVNHVSALIFVSTLIYILFGWLRSQKDITIFLYAVSLVLVSITIIISLVFLELYYSRAAAVDIRPYPIHMYVITITAYFDTRLLGGMFSIFSLASFSIIWIATVTMLNQYRYKLGKIKFYTLISIPLIYYLLPLASYFGDPFSSISFNHEITFGLIYALIFSATNQVGAVIFSLVFWTASGLVVQAAVRKSLLMSAIGTALLFGSVILSPLQYMIFPPFGFITQAVMPIGAYLLLLGIYTSAKNVSQDAHLRKQFFNAAKNQLTLLRTIGVTQMEKELVKKYKSASGMINEPQDTHNEEDVKKILREVLNELYPDKTEKTKE